MKNQIKTFVLLALLTGIFLVIGSFWGGSGLTIAFIFALAINFGSYWFSDKIVLAMYRAKEVSKKQEPQLHKHVKELAKKAGIPKPKIYLVPSESPNAFATGRSPKNSAVACTRGILKLLDDNELRGVLAHEISHIKNRDTLIQTIAATIAGAITYIAFMARWAAIFGTGDEESSIVELLALAIITPIAATLIQLSISRSREFIADKKGASLIGSGKELADALEKLEHGNKMIPLKNKNKSTSSLFIINPFSGSSLLKLLSTHPPVKERIKRLREM